MAVAIKDLVVRRVPEIGIAAAYGAVLAIEEGSTDKQVSFNQRLDNLEGSRPTAINLAKALNAARTIKGAKTDVLDWANKWLDDDIAANITMGKYGARCFQTNTRVMTHCNARALATGAMGRH